MPRMGKWIPGFAIAVSVVVVACTPPLAATPTAAPPAAPAAQQAPLPTAMPGDQGLADAISKYYEAARQEGKLVIYGVGNPTLFNPIRDAFMQRFPGIQLEGVDQRGRESREKVFAEQQSRNYVVDVVSSGFDTQSELLASNFVEPYQAAEINSVIPELVPPGGQTNPRTVSIFTMTVNTNLVPPDQEPKVWTDVLDPKWKGKLAMDDPRGSGPGGTIISGIEALYGLDTSARLAEQGPFFATQAGPIWTALVRGEYAIFLSSNHTDAIAQRKAGAPIKLLKPQDGVGITQISQSIIKGAPHPNAAKLWVEWSLSEEGQTLLAQQGYATVRKGMQSAEPEASLEGVKFLPRDDDPETFRILGDRTKRWEQVFFKTP